MWRQERRQSGRWANHTKPRMREQTESAVPAPMTNPNMSQQKKMAVEVGGKANREHCPQKDTRQTGHHQRVSLGGSSQQAPPRQMEKAQERGKQPPEIILSASGDSVELSIRYRLHKQWQVSTNLAQNQGKSEEYKVEPPSPPPPPPPLSNSSESLPPTPPQPPLFNSRSPTPPPTVTNDNKLIDTHPDSTKAAMAGRRVPPTEGPSGLGGQETPQGASRASQDEEEDVTEHVARRLEPGADFRLLSASRVSKFFILATLSLLLLSPPLAKASTLTSQIWSGIALVEADHHPLQLKSLSERYDLSALQEASKKLESLESYAKELESPSIHPLLQAATACPSFTKQSLQSPLPAQKSAYDIEGHSVYAGWVPTEAEGSRLESPVLAWTHSSDKQDTSSPWLTCSYTLQPGLLFTQNYVPPNYHYVQQKEIWRYFEDNLESVCTKMEVRRGTLLRNSRRVSLPNRGMSNILLCQELCTASHHRAEKPLGRLNCTGERCTTPDAGCSHYSYNYGPGEGGEEACYLYAPKSIREADIENTWSQNNLLAVTAARRCVHPDLKGHIYMGAADGGRINVRENCEFVTEPPLVNVIVTCTTAASHLRAWMEPLKLQIESTFKSLEGWSPLSGRRPQSLPSSRAPATISKTLSSLTANAQVTTFMSRALMGASRMSAAVPVFGPWISSGLLLASTIIPTAIHLCLESWSLPDTKVIDTAYSLGSRNMAYYGDGTSKWNQYNETNLLYLKSETPTHNYMPDVTAEMAYTALQIRKAVTEVKALVNKPAPLLESHKKAIGRRKKFGVITTVDRSLAHLSRIYFYLDEAQPVITYRTAVILSLDPELPLVEGRAVNSPTLGHTEQTLMECYDSLRAHRSLPEKCYDTSRSGSSRSIAVPFVNDSLLLKVLGEQQIQLSCPERHGIFFGLGTFLARISESCSVVGDGGAIIYEPPRTEHVTGAQGDFSIIFESAPLRSPFDPPIQARVTREVRRILKAVVTWTDLLTYVLLAVVTSICTVLIALAASIRRLGRTLRIYARRSERELAAMVNEEETHKSTPKLSPPPRKKVTFELSTSSSPPKTHSLAHQLLTPRPPMWKDAGPAVPRLDQMV